MGGACSSLTGEFANGPSMDCANDISRPPKANCSVDGLRCTRVLAWQQATAALWQGKGRCAPLGRGRMLVEPVA